MKIPLTNFIDTHVHLGDPQFDGDRAQVISRALERGVNRLVEIADHPDEWQRAIEIARQHPTHFRCALGLHPYYADLYNGQFLIRLKNVLETTPQAIAIGEIGLDYAKAQVSADIQRQAFTEILQAGKQWNVPFVIHCRDAYHDLIPILKNTFLKPPSINRFWGVIHCFSGNIEEAMTLIKLGFCLGVDGPITYKKNDQLREAFRQAGPEYTVLETDCPYLPPQSSRGKRNEPLAVVEIAQKLSEIWSLPIDEVATKTSVTAAALYRWG